MTLQKIKSIFSVLLLVGLLSCGRDDGEFGHDRVFIIEPEFQEYVDRFFEEAEFRGRSVAKNNLEVLFVDQLPGDFCGYGYSSFASTQNARVEIMNVEGCWHSRTPLEKENFMFHELGHALLQRQHLISRFDNEYPASLMCSSEEERGILGCNNYQTYYQTDEMRSYYLDELFNGLNNTEEPSWVSREIFTSDLFVDSIGLDIDSWVTFGDLDGSTFFLDSSGLFGNSKALAISLNATSADEIGAGWLHRFEIDEIDDCSSIKARAKVKTTDTFEGVIQMGLSLRELDNEGELNRFMFHRTQEDRYLNIKNAEWMEIEIYCVPERSEVVTISFMLLGNSPDTIYIDDVEVELWN